MATSSIPAAITALVALLQGSAGLSGVTVYDGPPTGADTGEYVAVGHDPLDPLNAVEASQASASLGNRAREESYDILCSLAAASGQNTIPSRRTRALALFAAVEAAVRADVTLDGAVRSAQIGTYSLVQELTDQGASVGLRFRIACSARLT